jgi:hypothetical protein
MTEQIILWCGLVTVIGASLGVLGFGVAIFAAHITEFWRSVLLTIRNTKEWVIYVRWCRRYRAKEQK